MAFYVNMKQFLDLDISEHYDSSSIYNGSCLCIPQDSLHEVFETFPSIISNKPISWRDLGIDPDFKDVSFGETFLNFEPKLLHEFEFNIGTCEAEGREGEEEAKRVTLKGIENYENKLIEPAFFEPKLSRECESNIGTHEAEDQEGEEEAKMVTLKGIENYENKLIEPFLSGFVKKKNRTKRCWQKDTKVLFGNHKMPKKCTHCRVERTPQWRAGPLGPKTLCNACGVRFKLGKLLPEYRPAASPEFDGKKYSNFHKKIMKRKGCSAREVNRKKVLCDKYGIGMGKPNFYNKHFVH